MADSDLNYTFTCPSCAGTFSILLERIPPVQARFRCPHCKQPMDFPSREEARIYARLQTAQPSAAPAVAAAASPPPAPPAASPSRSPAPAPRPEPPPASSYSGAPAPGAVRDSPSAGLVAEDTSAADNVRFRIEKPGFETDVFDRRAIRNLIRTGEISETDRVRMDSAEPVPASSISFLKGLFALRKTSRISPPISCRTHTDKVAHFKCRDAGRPLCEDCAPERKFGATVIRVCSHCGGTATELVMPDLS